MYVQRFSLKDPLSLQDVRCKTYGALEFRLGEKKRKETKKKREEKRRHAQIYLSIYTPDRTGPICSLLQRGY